MSSGEMYTPNFEIIDVFKALRQVKLNELLPREGVFDFFYENSPNPGVSLFLRYKSRIKLFYIDHDDFILELKEQTPDWDINIDKNIVRIMLLYKVRDSIVPISFVFDISKKEYKELLIAIGKKKEIKLYYLSVLYGGLVLDSIFKIKVPPKIIGHLKKIK